MPLSKSSKRKRASAGLSAAVDTQRAAITPTITSPIIEAFAVKCSRKSELIKTENDCFIDCYNEEVDDAQEAAEDSATAYDGSWVWDSDSDMAGCGSGDSIQSFEGGGGVPVVFKDRAAAEAAAFSVWQAMLLAQKRPSKPLLQQLEEQALGITSKQLQRKADERRRVRHRQRREQHEQEWELQRQEYARQQEQQLQQWQHQQQQIIEQHQKRQPLQQQRSSRRGRKQQKQVQEPQEPQVLQQMIQLLQQQPRCQPPPRFNSATPPPERRIGPSGAAAAADSDTDSVVAAKLQAAEIDAAVSAGDQQAYQQLLSRFHTVSADGLSAWQADVEWLSDPWADAGEETIQNVVLSTVRVEVIRASFV